MPCCCQMGAAVKGEWPEFECHRCPVHKGSFSFASELCKRHRREAESES
jgi:hypothetical protein